MFILSEIYHNGSHLIQYDAIGYSYVNPTYIFMVRLSLSVSAGEHFYKLKAHFNGNLESTFRIIQEENIPLETQCYNGDTMRYAGVHSWGTRKGYVKILTLPYMISN